MGSDQKMIGLLKDHEDIYQELESAVEERDTERLLKVLEERGSFLLETEKRLFFEFNKEFSMEEKVRQASEEIATPALVDRQTFEKYLPKLMGIAYLDNPEIPVLDTHTLKFFEHLIYLKIREENPYTDLRSDYHKTFKKWIKDGYSEEEMVQKAMTSASRIEKETSYYKAAKAAISKELPKVATVYIGHLVNKYDLVYPAENTQNFLISLKYSKVKERSTSDPKKYLPEELTRALKKGLKYTSRLKGIDLDQILIFPLDKK